MQEICRAYPPGTLDGYETPSLQQEVASNILIESRQTIPASKHFWVGYEVHWTGLLFPTPFVRVTSE